MKTTLYDVTQILTPASGFIKRCGFDYTLNTALGCGFWIFLFTLLCEVINIGIDYAIY